jgi:hypothetical protein
MFAASKSGRAATATDPFFRYVPLLLETTTTNGQQNNTFLDSSTNNYTLTRSGTPTQGSVTPYWPEGYWSNYLTSSTDYVNVATSAGFAFPGAFTVEGWFFWTSTPPTGLMNGGNGNGAFGMYTNGAYLGFNIFGSGNIVTTGSFPSLNTWHHVAMTRDGSNNCIIWVDGVNSASAVSTQSFAQAAWLIYNSSGVGGNCYISNYRIVKGVAVYTGTFTPPTSPLQKTQSAGTNIAAITGTATSLLTCQSNRLIDNSTSNLAVTATGSPRTQPFQPFSPAASYTTAAYGGSIYNGTKTDVVTAASVAALTTFTGDFTIECWVYPTDTGQSTSWGILDTRTSGQTATSWVWGLNSYISSPAGWLVQFYNAGANNFTTRVPSNVWSHLVLQRNGTTLRSFVNGVVDATTFTLSGTLTGGSSTVYIANTKDNALSTYGNVGYTSNLRIVNGTAVYSTSGFTPPTAPVTAITNTSLLVNATNAGIYDAAVQNNQLTVGSAQASTTQAKWSPTSMSFNGTTDYLTMPVSPGFSFGTGNFTIEAWIYNTSSASTSKNIFSHWSGGAESYQFYLRTNNRLLWQVYTQNSPDTAALAVSVNAWNHVAWTRSGNTAYLHINGVLQDTTSLTNSANGGEIPRVGAGQSGTQLFPGYIQDLRVTKGIARYGATNFTPPTAAFPTR